VGQPITFAQQVSGAVSTYRYDWDGNGSFEQSSTAPVLQHAYLTSGFFRPRLQVQGPSGTATFVHAVFIAIQAPASASSPAAGGPALVLGAPAVGSTAEENYVKS
jgi:hypothetical protein